MSQAQQQQNQQVAPGFEAIAQAIVMTLEGLSAVGLNDEDRQDAKSAAEDALTEVTKSEPDRGKLRRALAALKGFLAPIASGLVKGLAAGSEDWARTAVEQLGVPF